MNKEQELKDIVRERYAKIAEQGKAENAASCCGATTPSNKVYNIMMDDYTETEGYVADADLGLGCGLPTEFEENPELENWTNSQMTYFLKEARKMYHTTGEIMKFHFNEVYPDHNYLTDKVAAQDHVGVIGMSNADRMNANQKYLLQKQWNNLKSPANPRNYFHGKVTPQNQLDKYGNYVFCYVPMEYEKRWVEEGIDLRR